MGQGVTLATEAGVLRQALLSGMRTVEEIIVWADARIMSLSDLPDPLVAVSLCGGNINTAISELGELAEYQFTLPAFRLYARMLLDEVESRPESLFKVSGALYRLTVQSIVPKGVDGRIHGLDDGLHLAQEGIYGSVEEARKELVGFLREYAA